MFTLYCYCVSSAETPKTLWFLIARWRCQSSTSASCHVELHSFWQPAAASSSFPLCPIAQVPLIFEKHSNCILQQRWDDFNQSDPIAVLILTSSLFSAQSSFESCLVLLCSFFNHCTWLMWTLIFATVTRHSLQPVWTVPLVFSRKQNPESETWVHECSWTMNLKQTHSLEAFVKLLLCRRLLYSRLMVHLRVWGPQSCQTHLVSLSRKVCWQSFFFYNFSQPWSSAWMAIPAAQYQVSIAYQQSA